MVLRLSPTLSSSAPAATTITPSKAAGNRFRRSTKVSPKKKPMISFNRPRNITLDPERAPNRYCAARPPDPWQTGIAPNQQPAKWTTATMEFSVVRGI